MSELVRFKYREFYDFPRLIVVECAGHLLLLDSGFDDEKDEYSDSYEVFELPANLEIPSTDSWEGLISSRVAHIGTVKISSMRFDSTRRNALDPAPLVQIINRSNAP